MKKILLILILLNSITALNGAARALAIQDADVKVAADVITNSSVFTPPNMVAGLFAMQNTFFKQNELWKPNSGVPQHVLDQQHFLDHFYNNNTKGELSQFTPDELKTLASRNCQELNQFLVKNGFQVQLPSFANNPRHIGVVSILSIAPRWEYKGSKAKFYYGNNTYDAVKLKDKGFQVFQLITHGNKKVVAINTKTKDKVYLALADKHNLNDFELAQEIDTLRAELSANKLATTTSDITEKTTFVQFPKIDIDITKQFPWLLGMESSIQGYELVQAFAQIKLQMDEFGVKLKSGFAGGAAMKALTTPEPFIIDKPFYMWIQREGFSKPIMYAYCSPQSWVIHNPAKADQEVDLVHFEELVDQGRGLRNNIQDLVKQQVTKLLSENPNIDEYTLFTTVLANIFNTNKFEAQIDDYAKETAELIERFSNEPFYYLRKYQVKTGRNPAWIHDDAPRIELEASGLVFQLIGNHADLMQCVDCGIEFRGYEKEYTPAMIMAFHKSTCHIAHSKFKEKIMAKAPRYFGKKTKLKFDEISYDINANVLARLQRFVTNYDASLVKDDALKDTMTNIVNKLKLLLVNYNDAKDYVVLFKAALAINHSDGESFTNFCKAEADKKKREQAQNALPTLAQAVAVPAYAAPKIAVTTPAAATNLNPGLAAYQASLMAKQIPVNYQNVPNIGGGAAYVPAHPAVTVAAVPSAQATVDPKPSFQMAQNAPAAQQVQVQQDSPGGLTLNHNDNSDSK